MTNHSTLKTAFQTKIIDRKSIRFNEWSMYLFTFLSRMIIIHRKKNTSKRERFVQIFDNDIRKKNWILLYKSILSYVFFYNSNIWSKRFSEKNNWKHNQKLIFRQNHKKIKKSDSKNRKSKRKIQCKMTNISIWFWNETFLFQKQKKFESFMHFRIMSQADFTLRSWWTCSWKNAQNVQSVYKISSHFENENFN